MTPQETIDRTTDQQTAVETGHDRQPPISADPTHVTNVSGIDVDPPAKPRPREHEQPIVVGVGGDLSQPDDGCVIPLTSVGLLSPGDIIRMVSDNLDHIAFGELMFVHSVFFAGALMPGAEFRCPAIWVRRQFGGTRGIKVMPGMHIEIVGSITLT